MLFKKKRTGQTQVGVGCGYLVLIGLLTSVLLTINVIFVRVVLAANREWLYSLYPDDTVQFRVAQALQIIVPVILIFVQYWFFDRLVDRAFGYGRKSRTAAEPGQDD